MGQPSPRHCRKEHDWQLTQPSKGSRELYLSIYWRLVRILKIKIPIINNWYNHHQLLYNYLYQCYEIPPNQIIIDFPYDQEGLQTTDNSINVTTLSVEEYINTNTLSAIFTMKRIYARHGTTKPSIVNSIVTLNLRPYEERPSRNIHRMAGRQHWN